MYVIAGKIEAKPEKRAKLIQLDQSMFVPLRAEVGCINYDFYAEASEKNKCLFFEKWQDKAAIDLHFQTVHFQAFMQFAQMIVSLPTLKIYEVREVEQL